MGDEAGFKVRLTDGSEFGPAPMGVVERWAQEGRVPRDALLVPVGDADGTFTGEPVRVLDVPRVAAIVNAPPTIRVEGPEQVVEDTTMSAVVPYRNKPALVGYYLAIFGCLVAILVPLLGLAMPIAAIVLGAKGLKRVKADPRVHGTVHAIIAIIGGSLGLLLAIGNLAVVVSILLSKK